MQSLCSPSPFAFNLDTHEHHHPHHSSHHHQGGGPHHHHRYDRPSSPIYPFHNYNPPDSGHSSDPQHPSPSSSPTADGASNNNAHNAGGQHAQLRFPPLHASNAGNGSTGAPNSAYRPNTAPRPPLHSPTDRFPPLSGVASRIHQERRMSEPSFQPYYTPSYTLSRPTSSGNPFQDVYEYEERKPFDGLHSPTHLHHHASSNAGAYAAMYDTGDEESLSRPSSSGSPTTFSYPLALPLYHPSGPGGGMPGGVGCVGVDNSNKTYSFVSLPGNAVRKRPRRRYDEIERLYACNYPGCTKAYGTLNHLNAHVNMQKHGPKRHPNEFKELRKQWRKVKKEEQDREARNNAASNALVSLGHGPPHPSSAHGMSAAMMGMGMGMGVGVGHMVGVGMGQSQGMGMSMPPNSGNSGTGTTGPGGSITVGGINLGMPLSLSSAAAALGHGGHGGHGHMRRRTEPNLYDTHPHHHHGGMSDSTAALVEAAAAAAAHGDPYSSNHHNPHAHQQQHPSHAQLSGLDLAYTSSNGSVGDGHSSGSNSASGAPRPHTAPTPPPLNKLGASSILLAPLSLPAFGTGGAGGSGGPNSPVTSLPQSAVQTSNTSPRTNRDP